MKTLCMTYGVPTARWTWVGHSERLSHRSFKEASVAIEEMTVLWGSVPVIKADGLCGGKGVVVAKTQEEAITAARDMLMDRTFGEAGSRIVIEERLVGRECSMMWLCDGENIVALPPARDYKRIGNGDMGANTGGMGAYSPLPDVGEALIEEVRLRMVEPILRAMRQDENAPFRGLLYTGLMLTPEGPKLLECNVRFGDPETQAVLIRLTSDIVPYLIACSKQGGLLRMKPLEVSADAAVCIVLVSEGYPDTYRIGVPIHGQSRNASPTHTFTFHAGTRWDSDRQRLVTAGGRIMSVVGLGQTIEAARLRAAEKADEINFATKYRRFDIAAKP